MGDRQSLQNSRSYRVCGQSVLSEKFGFGKMFCAPANNEHNTINRVRDKRWCIVFQFTTSQQNLCHFLALKSATTPHFSQFRPMRTKAQCNYLSSIKKIIFRLANSLDATRKNVPTNKKPIWLSYYFFSILIRTHTMKNTLPKILLSFIAILWMFVGNAQIITTVVGTGIAGFDGDGSVATLAKIGYVNSIALDKTGNLFIADCNNSRIRKVDVNTGIINTIAGNGISGYSGDGGPATLAQISGLSVGDVAVDDTGNIYISDAFNFRIRKVTVATGEIKTIAGTGVQLHTGDGGNALLASFGSVNQLTLDAANNIYVNDSGCWIRKISTLGIIVTVAGTGNCGYSGDGGDATAANIVCGGLACDGAGNIYFADPQNFRIRRVDALTGKISTVGGNGSLVQVDNVSALESGITPAYICFNKEGELLISEQGTPNNKIRKIDASGIIKTVAGIGTSGFSGDGDGAIFARLYSPAGLGVDTFGNFYVADKNNKRVRKISYPSTDVYASNLLNNNISLHSNPTSSILTLTSTEKINTLTLANTLGQVVHHQQCPGKEQIVLNLAHLPPGIYTLKINNTQIRRITKL